MKNATTPSPLAHARRCLQPTCDSYPCFGKKNAEGFTWACGDHRTLLDLPALPKSEYVAPQGRLL